MEIKTGGNALAGVIEENAGGNKTAKTPGGRIVWYYRRSSNETCLPGGMLVGYGLSALLLIDSFQI